MATPKKPVIPHPTTRRAAQPKKPAAKPIDLSALLNLPAQMEAGFQRVIDVLIKPALANSAPPLQTAAENAVERLEAILSIFTGKQAQHVLQDMLEAGGPPSREQLLRIADKHIAARGGK
ncbi:hypothetical protein RJO15_07755 [Herbaspirillum huttiense F1]|uniref:hypothetical protein n=1 Tax=Herbaspirillum huttiense TaxID=863372 RepID=UPI002883A733|nr:hypothetical protein [Herbaspirillum huttiense]MDT0355654.1 hypothetical protein [Herbaspirillum huttiense F1]